MMLALTLWRPWPWCFTGLSDGLAKRLENRDWRPPPGVVRGWIALHAGKTYDKGGAAFIERACGKAPPPDEACPTGIFAIARLVEVFSSVDQVLARPALSGQVRWFIGPCAWLFDSLIQTEEPIPCRGGRKLWPVPEEITARLRVVYKGAAGRSP